MLNTGTSQSELSRLSGVWQSSISQFLSGKVHLSDDQLDRLLSCMGYRLEVVWRPVPPGSHPLRVALLAAASPAVDALDAVEP